MVIKTPTTARPLAEAGAAVVCGEGFRIAADTLESICLKIAAQIPCEITFMAAAGTIVASSIEGRIGTRHEGAARILRGELPELEVSAEAAARSPSMLEGYNLPAHLEGKPVLNIGIAAPLAEARNYAAIVRTCVEVMLKEQYSIWKEQQQLQRAYSLQSVHLHDVKSKHEEAENRLRTNKERLLDIAEFMLDSIWETDADLRFTYVSEHVLQKMRLNQEDILGKTRWDFFAPLLFDGDTDAWQEHRRTMEAHQDFHEFQYALRRDEEVFYYRVSGKALFDAEGRFVGYRGAGRDVTAQVELEHELKRSVERFRNIAESTSDWIWEMDAQNRFTYLSTRFFEVMGYKPEDILGKTRQEFADHVEGYSNNPDWQSHQQDIENQRAFKEFEYNGIKPNGDPFCIKISGTPFYHNDGSFAGYQGIGTDYTAFKRVQQQLLSAEKLSALGGMVAGIAHEINTPVGIGVTAASHLHERTQRLAHSLEQQTLSKSELNEYLQTALEGTHILLKNLTRAAELTASFKQVSVDQSSSKIRTIGLKRYLDDMLVSLRPLLKKTAHKINIDCAEQLSITTNAGALYQVISNLIINSLQHAFAHQPQGEISLQCRLIEDRVELSYHDNGCGMDDDQLPHIFEPFFTTKRAQGNTGLGMNLVYNLVTDTLKGSINVFSLPGRGIRFKIELPCSLLPPDPSGNSPRIT
ncbi:PAS domain S-box protein [Aestuariirhabdus sp. LZHN29]|uniref:PAS domain S-box protein n=1 Tax=Aestuariirhabdus sp. LZHN29 TaxID=3417462 RepID=UPI003CE89E9A